MSASTGNEMPLTLVVNGQEFDTFVPVRMHAADFLRHRLGFTGTHVGCEQGACGMCTILVDGVPIKSCLALAVQLNGRDVRTVESLATGDQLSRLQEAFKRHHGLQCGFCTPAFLMLATALGARGTPMSDDAIREAVSGILCRCTGYEGIVRAVADYLSKTSDRVSGISQADT